MMLNVVLATRLAFRNLRHHRVVSAATVLGVAIGMTVVSAVLIVDNNTGRLEDVEAPVERRQDNSPPSVPQQPQDVFSVSVLRSGASPTRPSLVPTQEKQ